VWTFTTGAAVAVVSPEIVSTNPANAAINVPLNQAVSATFTEAMNPLTITTEPSNSQAGRCGRWNGLL